LVTSLLRGKDVSWQTILSALAFFGLSGFTYSLCEFAIEKVHLTEYVLLTLAMYSLIRSRRQGRWILSEAWLWTFLLGVIDEIWQWMLPGRYFDIRDIIINALSALLGVLFITGILGPWQDFLQPARHALARARVAAWAAQGARVTATACLVCFSLALGVANNSEYRLWKASKYAREGHYRHAIMIADEILSKNRDSTKALKVLLSSYLMYVQDLFGSDEWQIDPVPLLKELDRAYGIVFHYDTSRIGASERAEVMNKLSGWYEEVGSSRLQKGDIRTGVSSFYKAHFLNLAVGSTEESRRILELIIDTEPGFGDAYYQLGAIDEAAGEQLRALEGYRKATRLVSNHLEALQSIVRLEEKLGKEG
jgi:tetratricopeptide (TPR) repeat protein